MLNHWLPTLVVFILGTPIAFAEPTLAPPSTFGPESSTISGSTSGTVTPRPSSSKHVSGSASTTQTASTAFPSLGNYPPCVTNCLAVAVSAVNCTSVVDVNCYCRNGTLSENIVNCIAKDCPDPQTLSTAESLVQQFCNLANTSTSLSFPSTSFSSSSTPASSSSLTTAIFPTVTTSTAPSATTSSAARLNARLPHDIIGLKAGYSLIAALLVGAYILQ